MSFFSSINYNSAQLSSGLDQAEPPLKRTIKNQAKKGHKKSYSGQQPPVWDGPSPAFRYERPALLSAFALPQVHVETSERTELNLIMDQQAYKTTGSNYNYYNND